MQGRIHELTELRPGQLVQLLSIEHSSGGTPARAEAYLLCRRAVMLVNLSLSPGYRLKVTRASRMSELADRVITAIAAVGGSAAFPEVLRRWLQRRQDKRQEQLQLDVRILEEGHALRQEAYQREREAHQALAEERERRHKAELLAPPHHFPTG